jgi:hypothetical protein
MPLLPFLSPRTDFLEPCCGDGELAGHLESFGHRCQGRFNLPDCDARYCFYRRAHQEVCFITNPPWSRSLLHRIITNLSDQGPFWCLLDADWMHTKQSIPYQPRLRRIISIGRVRWIEGSKSVGKDNAVWCLFTRPSIEPTLFFGPTSAASPWTLVTPSEAQRQLEAIES